MFFFAKYVMRIDSLNLLVLTGSLAYHLINTRTDLKQILFSRLMWWINEQTYRNISTDDNANTCAQMFLLFCVASQTVRVYCLWRFYAFLRESNRIFGWISSLDIVTFVSFVPAKLKNYFGWLATVSLLQCLAIVTSKELLTELYQELFLWFSLNCYSRKTILEVVKKPFVVLRNG